MSGTSLLQLALAGPLIAGLAWLALVRIPLARRIAAGVLGLGAVAAAVGVLAMVYRGDEATWRSFDPGLLAATIVVVVEVTLLLAAARAESLPEGGSAPAIAALAVSASAVAALAYSGSVAVAALALPLPTVAAAGAAFAGRDRADARGLIGLAAADAVALMGLSLVYARTASVSLGEAGGLGPVLLLAAALAKAGSIPGVATWRLAAGSGPASWLAPAFRGQSVVLAALAALAMRSSAPAAPLAIAAAVGVVLCASAALTATGTGRRVAAVTGAGSALPFLALGLGGAVGTRAFLLLFPAVLLSATLVEYLARENAEPERASPAGVGYALAACAAGVALGSLLGVPPGGGFPGTWLTLSLATSRSEVALGWLLLAAAAGAGLVVAFAASIELIRAARARLAHAVVGSAVALALLYVGAQPIRIGIGWWIRIETALELPEVLPTAGAPGLPAIGGLRLVLLLAPAAFLVLLVVGLGRGARLAEAPTEGPAQPGVGNRLAIRAGKALAPLTKAMRPVIEQVNQARARGYGYGIALVLELAAAFLVARIVVLAARAGFL